MNCYWSGLFAHGSAVYILGTSQQYGSIVIRRSEDGGFTWTHPADASSGLLFKGSIIATRPTIIAVLCQSSFTKDGSVAPLKIAIPWNGVRAFKRG